MENKYIIFDTIDDDDNFGLVHIVNLSKSMHYYGQKSTPNGKPYLIVSQSQLPQNFGGELGMYTIDFSNPHGFGSGSDVYNSGNGSHVTGSFPFNSYDEWVEFYKDTDLI